MYRVQGRVVGLRVLGFKWGSRFSEGLGFRVAGLGFWCVLFAWGRGGGADGCLVCSTPHCGPAALRQI